MIYIVKAIGKNTNVQEDGASFCDYTLARERFDELAANRNNHIVRMIDGDTNECILMHIDYK